MHLIAALPSFLTFGNLIAFSGAVLGLGVVIFVHELGHFLVAKACGVKCEKFYVGFDVPISIGPIKLPAALWKKQWGETEYGIGIVPLGGYVKMLGQHDNPQMAAEEAEKIKLQKDNPDSSGDEIDPRSYPAKTVLQRMAIISAGVIFNLIFGIIFAAIAYKIGVPYVPTMVGKTVPGDSAWRAGLTPGESIVQFHRDGKYDEKQSFDDMRFHVFWIGDDKPLDAKIKDESGTERWVAFQPKSRDNHNYGMPTIGVVAAASLDVLRIEPDNFSVWGKADLEEGDTIVSVDIDGATQELDDAFQLRKLMISNPDKEIQLAIDRTPKDKNGEKKKDAAAERLTVTLPPQPMLDMGMVMKMGPVVAVQDGSPGESSGFKKGDVLLSVAGQSIADPLRLDHALLEHIGQSVTVTVQREDQQVDLTVTPRSPDMTGNQTDITRRPDSPVSAETLGVAYAVRDEIAAIEPGGPADKAGLAVGDKILNAVFIRADDGAVDEKQFKKLSLDKEITFSRETDEWAFADKVMQRYVPDGVHLKLTYERDGKAKSVDVTPSRASKYNDPIRGMLLGSIVKDRKAESIGEALHLGWKQIKHGVLQVFMTLGRIGKTYKGVGGPISIAAIATSYASEGLPSLLLFLTMISANLAVLNFLPIPVLDGGHIMFLLYEGIFGKPMNEKVAFYATMIGLSMILSLMVFAIGMDITRLPMFFSE